MKLWLKSGVKNNTQIRNCVFAGEISIESAEKGSAGIKFGNDKTQIKVLMSTAELFYFRYCIDKWTDELRDEIEKKEKGDEIDE